MERTNIVELNNYSTGRICLLQHFPEDVAPRSGEGQSKASFLWDEGNHQTVAMSPKARLTNVQQNKRYRLPESRN